MTYEIWLLGAGLVAAGLSTLAYVPYMRSMICGSTRPLRSTWLIWAVLSTLSAVTNWAEGATLSMLFIGVQAGFTSLIFLMSLKFGMGGFLRRSDLWILGAAAVGIGLWWATSSPLWALIISLAVSALGGLATLAKTYHAPETESVTCWTLSSLASFAGILSVGTLDPVLLAYPVYLFMLYTSILGAIWLGRQKSLSPVPSAGVRPVPLLLCPKQRVDRVVSLRLAA